MKKIYIQLLPALYNCNYRFKRAKLLSYLSSLNIAVSLYKVFHPFYFFIIAIFSVIQVAKGQIQNNIPLTHNSFNNFNASSNPGTPTTCWFNLHTKLSGELSNNGDYISFVGGSLNFTGIITSFGENVTLPNGKIVADNTVTIPITSFDTITNTWITKVPLAYNSANIFIAGAAITSSNGFKVVAGKSTNLSGYFYSNKSSFTSSWFYGLACYQSTFTNASVGIINAISGSPVSGRQAGTPTSQTLNLVAGGSGGGGSNYTGSYSSTDNYTAYLTLLKIGKVVWNDTNYNGILDVAEPAIPNIEVNLYLDANKDNLPDGISIANFTTDAKGLYNFSNLLPNNYIVGVQLPGNYVFATTTITSATPDNKDSTDNNGVILIGNEIRSNSITLAEGNDVNVGNLTVNFAFQILPSTLPIKLTNFVGMLTAKNTIDIKWATETEDGTENYILERSTDGRTFSKVYTIHSARISIESNYGYRDNITGLTTSGVVYYRVKIYSHSALYSISKIVKINSEPDQVRNYISSVTQSGPRANPVVNFYSTVTARGLLKVLDADGKVLVKTYVQTNTGLNSVELPARQINTLGIKFIQMDIQQDKLNYKFFFK